MVPRALLLSLAIAAIPAADERTPVFLMGGWSYLNSQLRAQTTDGGVHGGMGYLIGGQGLFGQPSLDLDARYAGGRQGRAFSGGVSYAERGQVPGEDKVYIGLGVGSHWHDISITREGQREEARRWRPGAKGMLGMLVAPRLFVEGGYHWTGRVSGLDTSGITVSLGYWF